MMNRGQLPTKWLSDSNWGALDHESHAPQLLSDNYYVHVCVHMYMCVCVCGEKDITHAYAHTYTHTCTYAHTHVHTWYART